MLTLLQPSFVHSRTRRKGQALILAVLVMLFAVLLSTAFLVVIGNNGRQVGRETDRAEASRNADKGVAFVVSQLRASSNPDSWDPSNGGANLPTTTSDMDIYYSQLDKAMGWDVQKFVKYPNPLSSRQASQFLVSSHLLGTLPADDQDGGDKRFMLRITVIGLSSKNPEVWSRRVLYKTTNWNGGTFSYSNFVTAFDPDTQKSIVSALAAPLTVNATDLGKGIDVAIYSSKGQGNDRVTYSPRIAAVGSTLMISDGISAPVVGIVAPRDPATPTGSIRLRILRVQPIAPATSVTFAVNAKVALVGSLFESTTAIDENGNQGPAPLGTTQPLPVVSVNATPNPYPMKTPQPLGNGAQYNNGLSVPERVSFAARPPLGYSSTILGQNALTASGPVSINNQLTISDATGQTTSVVGTETTPAQNQFFRASYPMDSPSATPSPAKIDTANSIVSPVIVPRTIKPAPLDFASYRTKAMGAAVAGHYGYGPGVYIDNSDDVEKFNGQPLTTGELQRLWQRKSFPVTSGGNVTPVTLATGTTGARLCYGRPGVDAYLYPMTTGGLEAQGVRGWISPWEFLPRGTQIILNGTNNTITIIRDALDDKGAPSDTIAWKNPDGTKATQKCNRMVVSLATQADGSVTATYTVGIATGPTTVLTQTVANFNGILCAEGNVRVKGTWTNIPLTIVSGNNIYIEGNLSTRDTTTGNLLPGKLALLAKKNVVLNPTQFISRPEGTVDTSTGRTAVTGTVTGGAATFDTSKFKLGDKVAIFIQGQPADGWHVVTGISPTTLAFTPSLNLTSIPDNTKIKVKLACDPPLVLLKDNPESTTDYFQGHLTAGAANDARTQELDPLTNAASAGTSWAYKFAVGGDTLARTVPFGGNIGVAMSQAAEKKNVSFTVKGGDDSTAMPAIVDNGERKLVTKDSATPFQLLIRPQPGKATDPAQDKTYDLQAINSGSTGDANSTLTTLKTQLLNTPDDDTDGTTNRWHLVMPTPVPPATVSNLDNVPARRLAKTTITTTITDLSNEETTPTTMRVPLASSVLLFGNDLGAADPVTLNPLLNIGSTFGFQTTALTTAEDPTTISADFYGTLPKWSIPNDTTVDNKVVYALTGANGVFTWTRDGAGDFDDNLPAYYLSALRFQKVDDATNKTSVPATAGNPKINMGALVDATIYAEGGSWFIIPVPASIPANAGLGADQQVEWRRPAYAITLTGNITQMMTPSTLVDYDDEPDADGVIAGAMKRWTDSLSYQTLNGTATNWRTINYQAAPLPALAVDAMGNVVINSTTGLPVTAALPRLPASTDILYTYSN